MDTTEFMAQLEKFPQLKTKFEEMLEIAINSDGKIELADDAEERIITAGHQLNRETLQTWAQNQASSKSLQFEEKHKKAHKDEKKNFTGIVRSERS
jgi:hypothetical protein